MSKMLDKGIGDTFSSIIQNYNSDIVKVISLLFDINTYLNNINKANAILKINSIKEQIQELKHNIQAKII